MILFGDLETFNEQPITVGTHRYAETAEIMLFAWAIDNGPVNVWDITASPATPRELQMALMAEEVALVFQNSAFDRTVLRHKAPALCPPLHRWRDSMVKALAHSLPGALEKVGNILGLPDDEKKDKEGKDLVRLFCQPRPKGAALRRATAKTHPVEWARFKEYCVLDVIAMRECWRRLPEWNYKGPELALWHLDQTINDRGVCVDLEFAKAAIKASEEAKQDLGDETMALTNNQLTSTTRRDATLKYLLDEFGVDLPDLKSSTLERRVNDETLPQGLRDLLTIRLQASMTSSTKYSALLKSVSSDGRLRGILQFDGANRTRRWAGRMFQPQNLMRPPKYIKKDWELAIQSIKTGCVDLIYDNVMEVCAATVRGALVAPKGKKLVVSDLANIEGRDQAWLAGESWKLQAFRDYDAGTGPDLYKQAYARAFRINPDDVDEIQRQIGKVMELALGYEGGVGAFVTFALVYGLDLQELANTALEFIPEQILLEATGFWDWTIKQKRTHYGLPRDVFIVCDAFKRMWRYAHPQISTLWGEMKDMTASAILNPGSTFNCRKFKMRRDGAWLRIALPSGRYLTYPSPNVSDQGQISYLGVNQYTRQWTRIKTYGGKLFENACQSLARDVMADNMPKIEAAGYEIVLTVHDEVICEAPDSPEFNAEHLGSLLASPHPWCADMPLAAGGFEAYRYRKD